MNKSILYILMHICIRKLREINEKHLKKLYETENFKRNQ